MTWMNMLIKNKKIVQNQVDSGYLGDYVDQVYKYQQKSIYLVDLDDCVDQSQENLQNDEIYLGDFVDQE